ncbi:MAG TPA: type I restriction enzyme endonuclease domain-containing protein [Chthoniobacterales bacterium]
MIDSPDYFRIKTVHSFEELVATPFAHGVSAFCWSRTLPGDFDEVVEKLGAGEGVMTIEDHQLLQLALSPAGRMAANGLREDLRRLREEERDPVVNCIHEYRRDEEPGPVRTDLFSFHVDSAPVEADTWLCTYFGPASEGLRNEDARRKVDIPEIREQLREYLGAEADDDAFRAALHEHYYDLHYAAVEGARPYSFGVGQLWRIAVEWPGSPVPPCIHRAPATAPGEPPRLLLICRSDPDPETFVPAGAGDHAVLIKIASSVAFYDALAANDSAVEAMGKDELKVIAAELVTQVRKSVTIDWTVKEGARAKTSHGEANSWEARLPARPARRSRQYRPRPSRVALR